MSFPGSAYSPPGVYTKTLFDSPLAAALDALKLPVFIGEGNEALVQTNLEIVRGSSATVDQRVVSEDETGRAVASISALGAVTLGNWDGILDRFKIRNLPITTGDGTGTTSNNRQDVAVTINGSPVVVVSVSGATGLVKIAQAPQPDDVVRCTYYFHRGDTLFVDNVSDQVDPETAIVRAARGIVDINAPTPGTATLDLHGDILSPGGGVTIPANNVLLLMVDGTEYQITIPANAAYTMRQVAAAITAAVRGTLTASTYVNPYGETTLLLTSTYSLSVKEASANAILGLTTGQADNRVSTFYVFNGPIVDGTGGGVTTTDTSKVTVRVDGVQVIPKTVDGSTRAVTLTQAPKAGAVVTMTYYANTWQDTFDYLAHLNVTSITSCGEVPSGNTFIQGSDFVLQSDRVVWRTAALVSSGVHTTGMDYFDDTQVIPTLIDNRTYLSACTGVVTTSGGVSTTSRQQFTLPMYPTLGNGRDTSLGQSLFQSVTNSRIDVPANRPDVVRAYWGYDPQDALLRGPVTVTQVNGLVITLALPVPVGATVYASFYHNMLVDEEYTLIATIIGQSGVGQYQITNVLGSNVLNPTFVQGSKGAGLLGITLEFPSGSELSSDVHFESVSGTDFLGPVEEIVTAQFASRVATPARFAFPGYGPYTLVPSASDFLRLIIHGTEMPSSAGINLNIPATGHVGGFFAHLLSNEIAYTGGAVGVVGQNYDVTTSQEFSLYIDNAEVFVQTGTDTAQDISFFARAINDAASGHQGMPAAGGLTTITLNAGLRINVNDHYNGWTIVIGQHVVVGGPTPGTVRTITDYDGATGVATVAAWGPGLAPTVATPYYTFNPAARSALAGATNFNGPITITATVNDQIRFYYNGAASGALTVDILIDPGTYATPAALATHINGKVVAAILALMGGSPNHQGLDIVCAANAGNQLEFRLQLPGLDGSGFLQLLTALGGAARTFATLAGFDTAAATANGQAILLQGPVATTYEVPAAGSAKLYDRLILRNRLVPGGGAGTLASHHEVTSQCRLGVKTGNDMAGLATGAMGLTGPAVVGAASLAAQFGFGGGMNALSMVVTTFFDGTGATAANNVFSFNVDGTPVSVTFQASAGGTVAALGPVDPAWNGVDAGASVITQIAWALSIVPGTPFGNTIALVMATGMLRLEGAGLRITSRIFTEASQVSIGAGSANVPLGFSSGQIALRTLPEAEVVASALMNNRTDTFVSWVQNMTTSDASRFANLGLAGVVADASGETYLYIQDAPTAAGNLGTASTVLVRDTLNSVRNALFPGTGLNAVNMDGDTGEAAIDGFFVVSNVGNGSGSAHDSILNNGVGQDGIVGQTYRDLVTGLTFTILPRGWSTDQTGPWVAYPTGGTATFRFQVSKTVTCNANTPINALPGVELRVNNTLNLAVNDTAIVKTYERGGEEPAIGDLYYVTYVYTKEDFTTAFFTKMSSIEKAYGAVDPENPLTLAAYMAITNGAVIVGLKQVLKATDSGQASLASYRTAIDELEGVLPGQALPDIITPLRGDSTDLYQVLKRSNNKMSSIRYRSERTSIVGVMGGMSPVQAQTMAKALKDTRMRMVYPDTALISLTDYLDVTKEYLIDGPFLAAALVGSVVSPNVDVATPWTGRMLVGFTQLGRGMDAVEQNQTAQAGITVLEDRPPFLRVRHELTTDMTNVLTKLPTVIMIADEVQQQARGTLENFIGIKFLPGVLSQIEGRLSMMFKALVQAQIVGAYQGIKATVAADDPTGAEVEAYYTPIFPLLYIVLTFHLRSSS